MTRLARLGLNIALATLCSSAAAYSSVADEAPAPAGDVPVSSLNRAAFSSNFDASGTCIPEIETCDFQDDDCDGKLDEGVDCVIDIPGVELCNGMDEDFDDVIDEGAIGTNEKCGPSVGACEQGQFECLRGDFECVGRLGPFDEVCNGLDDDCDNVVDGQVRACYTPGLDSPTRHVGRCRDGAQLCSAEAGGAGPKDPGVECTLAACWGACVGERVPEVELCNALDDDCDGSTDEGIATPDGHGVGDTCCAFRAGDRELCGIGACLQGTWSCNASTFQMECAGGLGPSSETCNGVDDDCNGLVDDALGVGQSCQLANGCLGKLACNDSSPEVACVATRTREPESCNGLDDDCDGSIDELPDVLSDPQLAGACDVPVPEHAEPPCHAGTKVCRSGRITCADSVRPSTETCNDADDDCDGVADEGNVCSATGGTAGDAGGTGGGAGSDAAGGSGADSDAGGSAGSSGNANVDGAYGLATGGGGCACRSVTSNGHAATGWWSALLLAVVWRRKRRGVAAGYRGVNVRGLRPRRS